MNSSDEEIMAYAESLYSFSRAPQESFMNLSFISKNGTFKKYGSYEVFESLPEKDMFYVGHTNRNRKERPFFFDCERKFVLYSNWNFIPHLLRMRDFHASNREQVKVINTTDVEDIGENVLAIQYWSWSYGHFHDDLYNLYAVHAQYFPNSTILLDYPSHACPNHDEMKELFFGDCKTLNVFGTDKLYKMKNLMVIENSCYNETFHSFPSITKDMIINKLCIDKRIHDHRPVFITRSKSYRTLDNHDEIVEYYEEKGYIITNPETMTFASLVRTLCRHDRYVFTWGSTLTNIIYTPSDATILILKSQSYASEDSSIWKHVFGNRKIQIIESVNNNISLDKLIE